MRFATRVCFVLLCLTTGVLCLTELEDPYFNEPRHAIANSVNTFGADLLVEYRKQFANASVLFSPLSIASTFLLLYKGAEGRTRAELQNVFNFTADGVENGLERKPRQYRGKNSNALMASRIYAALSIAIHDDYVRDIGRNSLSCVDFFNSPGEVTEDINAWVSKRTNGLITDIVPDGVVNQATVMILVNALYFKGEWRQPFPEEETTKGVFHGIDGKQRVHYMKLRDTTLVYRNFPPLKSEVIQVPYKNQGFAMYIVLPNGKKGWKKAEKRFPQYAGGFFDSGYVRQEIDTFIMPKWEMEFEFDGLESVMMNMGVEDTFSPSADLSRMSPADDVYLSSVVHKTKIKVDEEGSEAAAATLGIVNRSAIQFPPINITVDRPFLYFIVDTTDRTVLFQGTLTSIPKK